MFLFVTFINYPGVAVVAEAKLRCGVFVQKKVVITLLVVSILCSWLRDPP